MQVMGQCSEVNNGKNCSVSSACMHITDSGEDRFFGGMAFPGTSEELIKPLMAFINGLSNQVN